MIIGMRCGNYVGQINATAIKVRINPAKPDGRLMAWTPRRATTTRYHHMFDAERWKAVTATTELDKVPQTARDVIEILETPEHEGDEDLTRVATSASDTARLQWTETTGASEYRVYRKSQGGAYGSAIKTFRSGQATYLYRDTGLDDGTWVYKVVAYDLAGNTINSNEPSVAVSSAPNPPSSLSLSVTGGTLTLTWTASTSADIDHYAIYRGTTAAPINIMGAVHATDVASPWSENVAALTGHYEYLLHAVDAGSKEEANLSQMVRVDLVAGVNTSTPNKPTVAMSEAAPGGEIRVRGQYDAYGEAGVATSVRLYVNDGAGGAIDYNTAVGTATLSSDARYEAFTIVSSGLAGSKTYLCVIRARTAAGIEDSNTTSFSVATDDVLPGAPVLTATLV